MSSKISVTAPANIAPAQGRFRSPDQGMLLPMSAFGLSSTHLFAAYLIKVLSSANNEDGDPRTQRLRATVMTPSSFPMRSWPLASPLRHQAVKPRKLSKPASTATPTIRAAWQAPVIWKSCVDTRATAIRQTENAQLGAPALSHPAGHRADDFALLQRALQ